MRRGYSLRKILHQRHARDLRVREEVELVLPCGHELRRHVGRGYVQRRAQCEVCGPDQVPEQLTLVQGGGFS